VALIFNCLVLANSSNAFGVRRAASADDKPAAASSTPQSRASCRKTKSFTSESVSFRYSSCWTSRAYDDRFTNTELVDVLSNQVTHNPCHLVNNSYQTCGWPLRHLQPAGLLIKWIIGGQVGWSLNKEKGSELSVGGSPARELIAHEACGSIGGDEKVTVYVSIPEADNYLLMTACLRSPGDEVEVKRINSMLESVGALV
jgi:hypothetical protein